MTKSEALTQLLSLPDEPSLTGRGYRYTCGRLPLRDADVIKRNLATAYIAWRRQDWGDDVSCVVSVRRQALYAVRRA